MSEILVNYNRLNINDIIYKKPEKYNDEILDRRPDFGKIINWI